MGAITNKIKTYSTLYMCEEVNGELPNKPKLQAMRISENGIAGTAEEITSDILLPDTRIESTPEVGTESNAGDVQTEWNIDEQDALFAGVFCSEWKTDASNANKKTLTLGESQKSFSILEKFPQKPATWQLYKNEYVNSLSMDFQTDSFAKLTWNFMGSNNPKQVTSDPLASKTPEYLPAMKTKSFITKGGMWLKIGDSVSTLKACRQSPSMSVSINNNLERTPALGEDESIENSLGNFVVDGTLDCYNVDQFGIDLYNDAVAGKDKVLQISVSRKVKNATTRYTLTMNVHLNVPSKSRNGNKFQFSVPFKVNDDTDLSLVKEVVYETPETPVFKNTLTDKTYSVGAVAEALDGTATVEDGGTLTYSWNNGTTEVSKAAVYTPSTSAAGVTTLTLTVTNKIGDKTSTATKTVKITVA